ncbi:hypothetical protein TSUD_402900 [Trifolium subterraneum]|uniref:DUF4283 domain-containing protein n=1 Tax=Trifolium subterraneum TaxID=3900 RepID=A0A2Z6PC71_TRISU|nr:hypothetical protein TSUD_402900 [Trifolium subterraneum]
MISRVLPSPPCQSGTKIVRFAGAVESPCKIMKLWAQRSSLRRTDQIWKICDPFRTGPTRMLCRAGGMESGDEREDEKEEDGEANYDEEEMKVEKGRVGEYECPKFIFTSKEEKRLYKPWRRGVIVKLLGRRIGYKALETRLKQMWVRKGIISIIDLEIWHV